MTDRFTIEIVPSPVYEIELTGRGPQGMQGPKGDTGAAGPAGPAGPQGPKGDRGDSALSFTVGETTELPTSNSAYVENVGTNQDIVLDFGIPRGLTGASGKGVDIGSIIQSLSKVAPDGFVHTWGESISQEENPELYQACLDGTLPTVNASNGGVSTIYAPNGIFKQTAGTNTLDINTDVVMELAKIGGVVDWNGSYNPQPTGNITLASLSQNTETQILMFTEGGQNEVHFRFLEGSYSGKLSEAPSNPSNNTLYFNTSDKTYYIYEGGDWNQYGASGVGYIYLGGIIVTADPATATWDNATFVSTDVTTTGLSEYDQQLVANKGNCGYFGLDALELSVRVPTMQNVFLEENDTEVGGYKEAGLPTHTHTRGTMNITGSLGDYPSWGSGTASGAFTKTTGAAGWEGGTDGVVCTNTLNASRSWTGSTSTGNYSSPLETTNTVQPEAIAVYFYVCVSKYTQLEQGPYFTPHVDSNGILSWTNNGGLVNPPNVDITGPAAFTVDIGDVITLNPDQQATVTNVGTAQHQVWDIAIPRGETGDISGKANVSLDNLNNEGMNIANWSTNVTNCITEIPQRIKYTLEDGTLTTKAGSVVIVPYGTKDLTSQYPVGTTFLNDNFKVYDTQFADGKFFVWAELVDDVIISKTGTLTSNDSVFLIDLDKGVLTYCSTNGALSGEDYTTAVGYKYYEISTNTMYSRTVNSETYKETHASLPIMTFERQEGVIVSIKQVFNGFGYMGSTIWADKGIKGLIPNGRNEDGTLKHTEFVTEKVVTNTLTDNITKIIAIDANHIQLPNTSDYRYNQETNYNLWQETTLAVECIVGLVEKNNNGINVFQIKQPFQALDYSDSSTVSGWSMPSNKYIDLTLGASVSTYTAPANGWYVVSKTSTASGQYMCMLNTTNNISIETNATASGNWTRCYLPVKKEDKISIAYSVAGTTNYFRFIYAEGEV